MSPMRFPRVAIVENNIVRTKGYLNKDLPQENNSYLYEIHGDNGIIYIVTEDDFIYIEEENNEPEW